MNKTHFIRATCEADREDPSQTQHLPLQHLNLTCPGFVTKPVGGEKKGRAVHAIKGQDFCHDAQRLSPTPQREQNPGLSPKPVFQAPGTRPSPWKASPWCEFTIVEGNHVYTVCKSIADCPHPKAFPNTSVINQIQGRAEPESEKNLQPVSKHKRLQGSPTSRSGGSRGLPRLTRARHHPC